MNLKRITLIEELEAAFSIRKKYLLRNKAFPLMMNLMNSIH